MWNWTENQIELYLIRHGMTLGNVEHRYIGRQTDEPLSEDGRQQLEKRKDQWAQVCRTWDMPYVFVSPMLRCRQTAEILFPQIPQIEIDPWREMDFGEFEGRNYAQLNGDPRYQAWIDSGGTLAFPGGEMCGWDGAGYGTDPAAAGIQSVSKVLGNGRQRYDTGAASGGGCGSRGYDHGAAFALLWR